jgi:flagellar hook-associated protein 3 FlgL
MNSSFFTTSGQNFVNQEALISSLQQKVATGNNVPTAAADPAAYVGAKADNSTVQNLDALGLGQTNISNTLNAGTSALSQAATVLDQIQSIALQAINGSTNSVDYQALGEQVSQNLQQMIGIANTQGSDGNYLFAGTAKATQPFVQSASGSVNYVGNEGTSNVNISPNVSVNAALSGSVFTNGLAGNGYATVSAASANTGSATLLATGISSANAATGFQTGSKNISVSFSSSGGHISYKAVSGSATLGSGPVNTANGNQQTITLDGVQFSLSGTPTAGDSFVIAPSRKQSVFSLVQKMVTALSSPGTTPASRAQTRQLLGNSLGGVLQYQNRISATSAKAGVIVRTINQARTSNELASTNAQNNADSLTAVNEPQVITQLQNSISSLQAAMKAFSTVSGLSLFNYI